MSSSPLIRYLLTALCVAACLLAAGCKGKSAGKMTDEEVKQAQAGPPKEMPAEGKAMMEQAKANMPAGKPTGPGGK